MVRETSVCTNEKRDFLSSERQNSHSHIGSSIQEQLQTQLLHDILVIFLSFTSQDQRNTRAANSKYETNRKANKSKGS